MKKFLIPMIVCLYASIVFYYIPVESQEGKPTWANIVWASLLGVAAVLMIANLVASILRKREPIGKVLGETMAIKITCAPFFVYNYIFSVMIALLGLALVVSVFFMATLPVLLIAFLVQVFGYCVMLSSGLPLLVQLIKNKNNLPVGWVIGGAICQFIPVVQLVMTIVLFVKFKDVKE